jgi:ERCC4-type nuclease
MVVLVLDTREHGLAAELTRLGTPFQTALLDVGDILIQTAEGEPLLVAERKTHADFAASLVDGRYREQRTRLMATRGQGIAVLYMLEGDWSPNTDRMFHGTSEIQLQRLTSRLILRYGMPVLTTSSLVDTARWCGRLLQQIVAEREVFHPKALAAEMTGAMATYTTTFSAVKKGNKDSAGVAVAMLSAVPGLGGKRVVALLAQKSIAELVSMSAEEIGALQVGGRKLGDKVGAALAEALHSRHT